MEQGARAMLLPGAATVGPPSPWSLAGDSGFREAGPGAGRVRVNDRYPRAAPGFSAAGVMRCRRAACRPGVRATDRSFPRQVWSMQREFAYADGPAYGREILQVANPSRGEDVPPGRWPACRRSSGPVRQASSGGRRIVAIPPE